MPNAHVAEIDFDPYTSAMHADPYPVYRELRAHAPVYRSERHGFWAYSRYDDVQAASRDWETYSYASGVDIDDTGKVAGAGNFLDADPPLHTRLRNVVRKAFVPKLVREQMEDFVRAEVQARVARFVAAGGGDLARDLAWDLPVAVAGEFIGYPVQDRPLIRRWADAFTLREPGTPRIPASAMEAAEHAHHYFAELIAERRRRPQDDLVSVIANAEIDGEPIGEAANGIVFLLFVASHETTAGLISSGLRLLGEHDEQRAWLAGNPDAIPDAVEEIVRYESPVQNLKRTTTRAVEREGAEIPAGSTVVLLYASANRDERRFDDAETFDIRREPQRNIAFGEGIHHCLGAPLARLEARIVLEEILQAMPGYELCGTPVPLPNHATRGLLHLPVTLR